MNFWRISASISVTITDFWTKFGTEHTYRTTNTLKRSNSHNLKIQDGGCRHLEFRKNFNFSGLNKTICTKFYGKMHHGHAEMTTWPKVETGSKFAWRHQMKVWRISASTSVTITDIWTKFGSEHKYYSINTPEWPNSHNQKSKMAATAILNFGKMSITPDWIKKWRCEDASRLCGDDHVMKRQNRKLIRVTSSNESQKHKCVDLSDYNIYLNQIWYRAQIPYY